MPDPTIWKFPINLSRGYRPEGVLLRVPTSGTFLHAAPSHGERDTIDTWWQVYPDGPVSPVAVHVVGTGHPVPAPGRTRHLATVPMPTGYVWHLYREHGERVYVGRGVTLAAVRNSGWYDGQRVVDMSDLRGRSFGLADIIAVPKGDDLDRLEERTTVRIASLSLPDTVTVRDLIREV